MSNATLNSTDAGMGVSQALPASGTEQARAEILALIDTMVAANHDKNAALFAAQFAPQAAVANLAPPLVHHGIDVEERQRWMDSWETPVGIEPHGFEVTVSGNLAFCHGFMRLHAKRPGAPPVDFWMRETLCLERTAGRWLIVHEHTSVPFYMDETLRPAFDLQPE